jgi:hypothetical protein
MKKAAIVCIIILSLLISSLFVGSASAAASHMLQVSSSNSEGTVTTNFAYGDSVYAKITQWSGGTDAKNNVNILIVTSPPLGVTDGQTITNIVNTITGNSFSPAARIETRLE